MSCPSCGGKSGGLTMTVGLVKVHLGHCLNCGRHWRTVILIGSFCIGLMTDEVERLKKRHPTNKPRHVKAAIQFLEAKIHDHALSQMEKDTALRKRRLDVWEKQFLKQALGEDE